MIRAIFFDFNGVIINDERVHLRAYREVLGTDGVALTDEDYFASLGMDDIAFVKAAYARGGHTVTEATMHSLIKREHELHRTLIAAELPIDSGVITFIKAAARHFQLGVVSMALQSEIDYVLEAIHVRDLFTVFVAAGQVSDYKPAPDCYRLALELLNERRQAKQQRRLLPSECLVIEDAPPGIAAGRAAGMRTLGITNTVSAADLRAAQAEVVSPGLGDWTVAAVERVFI